VSRGFYGASAVALGAWELAAFASGGRVPTVTKTVRGRRAHPVAAAAVAAWWVGLGLHFLGEDS
jgi:hypothetical protein